MATLLYKWYNKATQPFKTELYTYKFDVSSNTVLSRVKYLLSTEYYRVSPNITGHVKGNSFYAYHKWTMIRIKGGGKPASISGTIEPLDANSSTINIRVECHPTFWLVSFAGILLTIFLLLLLAIQKHFVISGEEWGAVVAISLGIGLMILLPYNVASSLTKSLRQTFEENMGIQPIDTHSV